jgi:hypothetical protein
MYDRERKRHEEVSKDATVAVIQSGQYSEWWDNFSKFMARQVPTIKKDIFASCLWTSVTVNEYIGPPVDVSIKFDAGGEVVPAMLSDLFAHQALVLQTIDEIYNEGKEYYDKSLVKGYDVANVPLQVDTKKVPGLSRNFEQCQEHSQTYQSLQVDQTQHWQQPWSGYHFERVSRR